MVSSFDNHKVFISFLVGKLGISFVSVGSVYCSMKTFVNFSTVSAYKTYSAVGRNVDNSHNYISGDPWVTSSEFTLIFIGQLSFQFLYQDGHVPYANSKSGFVPHVPVLEQKLI